MKSFQIKLRSVCLLVILFSHANLGVMTATAAPNDIILKSYTFSANFDGMSASRIASLFDMVQAGERDKYKIAAVKEIKPEFKALLYRNVKAINEAQIEEWQTAADNNWILKDADGNYVSSLLWPGLYIMDRGSPGYQTWVANLIQDKINEYGYDGVFTDESLRIKVVNEFRQVSAPPINPRTGTFWTDEEVKQASIQLFNAIKNAIGSNILLANGINRGTTFYNRFDDYNEVFSNSPIDGLMSEGFWYQYTGVWFSEQDWLKSLDMLVWLEDNFLNSDSKVFVPTTKLESLNGNPYPLPTNCTKEQMATYAYTSTLLGIKNSQNHICLQADPSFTQLIIQPLRNIEIGTPQNEYYMIEGTQIYARDFTNIKVLVNPTSSPYTITFQEDITNLDGETITEIILEPHTGVVLLK